MDKERELSLLSITAQYVAEIRSGRQPLLSDYLARYPYYANAIADFVAYYHALEDTRLSMASGPLIDRGIVPSTDTLNRISTNRAIMYPLGINGQDKEAYRSSQWDEQAEEVAFTEAMTTLLITATGQQLLLSQVAAELDLSIDIVLLLEQRAIAPATIPYVLCERIAVILQRSSAAVQRYLYSLDQWEPGSAVQKEKQPMKVAEEGIDYSLPHIVSEPSFRAIIETSLLLSSEQGSRWCTILDAERL